MGNICKGKFKGKGKCKFKGNCCNEDNVVGYAFNRDIYMRNFIDWNSVDDSVEMLSFKGQRFNCKVVSVYDGDTIKVVFPIFGTDSMKLYKWNCRINGVDTPELRTRNALEKEHGYLVRDKLREKILGKVVYVVCDTFDKYGRLLINVFIDGVDISNWLIDNEYAFKYDGGKKKSWGEFLQKKIVEDDLEDEVIV